MSDVDFFSAAHCPPAASATAVISYESSPVSTAPGSKGRTMSAIPSRRHVLKAGAWAVPAVVVASAAPAYAGSDTGEPDPAQARQCSSLPHVLAWSAAALGGTGNTRTAVARASAPVPSGVTVEDVRVTLVSQFHGDMRGLNNRDGKNMVVTDHQVGGLGTTGLELYQANSTGQARSREADRFLDAQTLQVQFDRAVSNLSFTITDIDANPGQFGDRVSITGPEYRVTKPTSVTGTGRDTSPWSGPAQNISHKTDRAGSVTVTFTQPVQAFSLRFWNASAGINYWYKARVLTPANGAQAIFLSNMTFTASTCV